MINYRFVNFRLSKNIFFQLRFNREFFIKDLYFTDMVKIILFSKHHQAVVVYSKDTVFNALTPFESTLKLLLTNELSVDNITVLPQGIAYQQSIVNYKIPYFRSEQDKKDKYFLGEYILWATNYKHPVIMYNKNNEIYMEIAPIFCREFRANRVDREYHKFIAHFKPFLIQKLEKQAVKKLHKKVAKLLAAHRKMNLAIMNSIARD